MKTDRLFTLEKYGGSLDLLQTDSVSVGEQLMLACSSEDSVHVTCLENGNFSTNLGTIKNCTKPLSVEVLKTANPCAPDAEFIFVGYEVPYQNHKHLLEVYSSCYSLKTLRTLYTQHRLQKNSLSKKFFILYKSVSCLN